MVPEDTASSSTSLYQLRNLAKIDKFNLEEPGGAQVPTVAISRFCFKVGQMTVPPRLVFPFCGLSADRLPFSTSTSTPSFSLNGNREELKQWEELKRTLNQTGEVWNV
jgi:hypothetical protein